MQNQKTLKVAAIIGAAVLVAGVFTAVTTTPITAYADRDYKKDKFDKKDKKDHDDGYDKDSSDVSKTITKQKLKQKNVGSGESTNTNCGENPISSLAVGICPDAEVEVDLGFLGNAG
jgi:hypothetical protein